ncbi:hypothetical protein BpHYR1_036321 [Brachionus plicatilis]|uniref:Uncharacterized protein n=1 Tax=Brachionus plicatilis TaxID=10195 RepID=A0A3M7PVX9_BRAPC|nr:hypothetical protein BpHYR1_036321 [Brachionus plicatilis]
MVCIPLILYLHYVLFSSYIFYFFYYQLPKVTNRNLDEYNFLIYIIKNYLKFFKKKISYI